MMESIIHHHLTAAGLQPADRWDFETLKHRRNAVGARPGRWPKTEKGGNRCDPHNKSSRRNDSRPTAYTTMEALWRQIRHFLCAFFRAKDDDTTTQGEMLNDRGYSVASGFLKSFGSDRACADVLHQHRPGHLRWWNF
jgi:hypothetical protein